MEELVKTGKYEEALKELEEKGTENPLLAGEIYFFTRRYDEAAESYENHLKENPYDETATLNLGVVYCFQGKKKKAQDLYAEYLQTPERAVSLDIRHNLALVFYWTNFKEGAIKQLEEVLNREWGYKLAKENMAKLLNREENANPVVKLVFRKFNGEKATVEFELK
jgi:tetratricopeptide (TPR) repeat protein